MKITPKLKAFLIDNDHMIPHGSDELAKSTVSTLLVRGELTHEKFAELSAKENTPMSGPSPTKVFGGSGNNHIRVKGAGESYSEKRAVGLHKKSGLPVFDPVYGREAATLSEAASARHGALLKHLARKAGVLQDGGGGEHEKALLAGVVEQSWAGELGGEYYEHIADSRSIKALLDDEASGGISITPIEFDSDILTFPLLNGELYPHVDIKPVDRGRRIESGSISNVSLSWGQTDGQEVGLFNTASLVAPLNTSIFEVATAIEVGEDFLSDSPVSVGSHLTNLVGEKLATELDRVVALGNGATEPGGLFGTAGVAVMNTDEGASGPPTLADYYSLYFSLPKQYRTPGMRCAFISNDLTYARSRQIKVDANSPSTDQRPALAPIGDIASYSTLGIPHRVQPDIPNATCGIACLSRYRMYRRLGLTIRWERGGNYLARKNLNLLIARARFGGYLRDPNAMAKWTDGQS